MILPRCVLAKSIFGYKIIVLVRQIARGLGNFVKNKAFHFPAQVRDSLKLMVEIPDQLVKSRNFRFSVIPA
jgi:hypothetical protein